MTRPLLFSFLLLLSPAFLFGQSYSMANGLTITDCSGTLYDNGGAAGNYGDNLNLVTTICSDGGGGSHVRLSFSGVILQPGDDLCFYDGPDITAPLLICASNYPPGEPFIVQSTAANPNGCLTVVFQSDASGNAAGFAAVISCIPSCQTVLSELVSTNPTAVPMDTGWIDICPKERIFLSGKGVYPQNGIQYSQSDLTTKFEWNFGDGTISYGTNASHKYDQPGGYYIQLFLTDAQGCRSTNLLNQRVRVAPRPSFNLAGLIDPTICAGDTLQLGASVNSLNGSTLSVTANGATFAVEGSRSDSLPIPDGTGIPYQTSIYLTEFSPGQILTNGNDLESICVNMEHSWIRDLEIKLTCPNGQSAILHNFGGQNGSEVFLGEPNDNDGFNPVPGIGYDYCWKMMATNPTWLQYANTVLGGSGTLPAGDYKPFQSFNNFIGCPLNGEWIFTATDSWQIDNGFLFSWSIKFKDVLYPSIETFTPQLTTWKWNNHPSIFYSTSDSIVAAPQNAGTAAYTFTVNDDFGCTWDTIVSVAVLPFTHPDCFQCTENYPLLPDTAVCSDTPVQLLAKSLQPDTLEVRFESFPDYKLGFANHPPNSPYAAPIAVNSVGYALLTVPTAQITSVCMDLETDFDGDLNVYLRSPNGKLLELSTANGGAGKNYKTTCFTPSATIPVKGSAAPFNGNYKPEGNWSDLNGAAVNGDWELLVSDGFGPNQFGKVKWWSIGFNFVNTVSYAWDNPASLSCANCPNPVATPSVTTTYTLTATDKFGCQHRDTTTLTIATIFPAPGNLQAVNVGANFILWNWDPIPGALGYEVQVNGGGWQMPAGTLSHQVGGLIPGDQVIIEVRATGGSATCVPAIRSDTLLFELCVLDAMLSSTTPVLCFGTSTGSAIVSVSNANPPLQFFADGTGAPFPNGDLLQIFPKGAHMVVVGDQTGCRDTVYFDLTEPSQLTIVTTPNDAVCNGENSGQAVALASGGTGTIGYQWQSCQGGPITNTATITGLLAGCYSVTATDANGCTVSDTVTISEPPAYQFLTTLTPVSCSGGADGSATITVSGSTPPYTYLWDNGQITSTATGLGAGFHIVTVTDAQNCEAATLVQLLEPVLLKIDSISSRQVSCFGGNNGQATVFPAGGTPPYQYAWDNLQTTQKAVGLSSGSYQVTVTDARNCTAVATVTVGSPTAITVSFASISTEICAGDCQGAATILSGGGIYPYTYTWDSPLLPANDTTLTALCPGVYALTVQDASGCSQIAKLTIDPVIPLDVHFDPVSPACAGLTNGSITTSVAGGTGPYLYAWSNGSTLQSPANLACGMYSVTITDAVGCSKIYPVEVICPAPILVSNIISVPVTCFGLMDGRLQVVGSGGNGTLTFQWSDPAAQTGSLAQNLLPDTYTVTITDNNNCMVTATGTVSQPAMLSINLIPTDVACFGASTGAVAAVAIGGTAPYTYAWNTMATDSLLNSIKSGLYTVTVQDAQGCTSSASVTINQPAGPIIVTVTQSRLACFGESDGQAEAMATGNNGAPFIFTWSDGQMGAQASDLPIGNITVTATDAKGCYSSQVLEIMQLENLTSNIISIPPSCYGAQDAVAGVNLIKGGAGMGDTSLYTYHWSVPGAPNSTIITGLAGGEFYAITITDLQGCSRVDTFKTDNTPEIMLTMVVQDVLCFGQNNGSVAITGNTGGVLPLKYVWEDGTTAAQISNLSAGMYQVTATDAKMCSTVKSVEVQQPQALTLDFSITPLVCSSDMNAAIKTEVQGGILPYSFQWNNGASTPDIQGLGPGNYLLTVRDGNGCILSDSVQVQLPDSLLIQVLNTNPLCFGAANGRLQLSINGGASPYRYSLDGGPFGGSSTFIGLKAGDYSLQIRDSHGCLTDINASLSNPPPLVVALEADTTIVLGQTVLLSPEINNASGLTTYVWRSALLENLMCVDSPVCMEILVKPIFTNTYFITVTDDNGCTGKASRQVVVEKPRGVYVPTGFSPNGDQENDRLVVHGKSRQVLNVTLFRVYDRWGELVYEDRNFNVNDDQRGWDGQWRGKDCDPGVFVWYLEAEYADGYQEAMKGEVTLIR